MLSLILLFCDSFLKCEAKLKEGDCEGKDYIFASPKF